MSAKLGKQGFIERSIKTHGDMYDYSEVEYVNNVTKVVIRCKKHDIKFQQTPSTHLRGQTGCGKCLEENFKIKRNYTGDDFIKESSETHANKYDYSEIEYVNKNTKVEIHCPSHNEWFWQKPVKHLQGQSGCKQCKLEKLKNSQVYSNDKVISMFREVHGDKYDYSDSVYINIDTPIRVYCNDHNKYFMQNPWNHKKGSTGCSMCSFANVSKGELELADFVARLGFNTDTSNRSILDGGFELDIVVPEKKFAIEFNGTYYHSDKFTDRKYHKIKLEAAQEKGLDLFFVWEHHWNNETSKVIIKEMIKSKLGVSDKKKIHARKCVIKNVDKSEWSELLNNHHIQGAPSSCSIAYGMYFEDELVSVMMFKKKSEGVYDLSRFCSKYNVRGAANKLFSHFKKNTEFEKIVSYSDRQHFDGGLYKTLGFDHDTTLPVDYSVYHPLLGIKHKSLWRRNSIPKRLRELNKEYLNFDPKTDTRTEFEMEDLVRALRVWDCGKIRWIYHRQ